MVLYQHALVKDLLRLRATRAEYTSTTSYITRLITAIRRNLRIFRSTRFYKVSIPSAGSVLREADCARTPESKVRVWLRSLDPIDSIGQLLSITVGRNIPAEGIRGDNI